MRPRVLIIEDDEDTRAMLKASLRAIASLEIHTANDGFEALRVLKATRFQLIFCDWNMPKMNGLEVLREARKEKLSQKTPFIMLTAEGSSEKVIEAIEAGATDYIVKPWTLDTLGKKLRAHVDIEERGPE